MDHNAGNLSIFFHVISFHVQHGETAIHLVAKYNHANVIAAFASFKVNVNIGGKVKYSLLHMHAHTHTHTHIHTYTHTQD